MDLRDLAVRRQQRAPFQLALEELNRNVLRKRVFCAAWRRRSCNEEMVFPIKGEGGYVLDSGSPNI